ncbi:Methionine--tRNA ligase [uncultured archaeon]|nr:Methionine--tRNA ligase [uncultured archaeon]
MESNSDIDKAIAVQPATSQETKPEAAQETPQRIDYDAFCKVEMRVATVLEAELVQGADKLLRLTIDVGTEKRQLVAGIARSYAPADLVGKQIVIVANLQPRKLRGVESNGMLLAVGESAEGVVLLTVDRKVDNGLQVK